MFEDGNHIPGYLDITKGNLLCKLHKLFNVMLFPEVLLEDMTENKNELMQYNLRIISLHCESLANPEIYFQCTTVNSEVTYGVKIKRQSTSVFEECFQSYQCQGSNLGYTEMYNLGYIYICIENDVLSVTHYLFQPHTRFREKVCVLEYQFEILREILLQK